LGRTSLPIFDGATEDEVAHELTAANPFDQSCYLHDGLTGDRFDQPVTVGGFTCSNLVTWLTIQMHARSIGP
jgi:DNA-directed RNA polymerase subunit beta